MTVTTFIQLWKNITLEPMLFLKMMAEGNMKVVVDTLQIHRVCEVNLNYSTEDCLSMDDGNHSLIQVNIFTKFPLFKILFSFKSPLEFSSKVSKYFQLLSEPDRQSSTYLDSPLCWFDQ